MKINRQESSLIKNPKVLDLRKELLHWYESHTLASHIGISVVKLVLLHFALCCDI